MERLRITLILLGASIVMMVMPAQATLVSYDFEVAATSGPLSGTTADGTFTFDGSVIPPGGGPSTVGGPLFTALSFTWDGIHYDQTTANTWGGPFTQVVFNSGGAPTTLAFGTAGLPGRLGIVTGTEGWYVSAQPSASTIFVYSRLGDPSPSYGTASIELVSAVPEPSTLLLLGSGLAGLCLWGRKNFRCI